MNKSVEQVILVDEQDNAIGTIEKLKAHQEGLLHRAFSVFLFNDNGDWLLQKRAAHKYHSPNLWSNACCSHPLPDEKITDAIERRLMEELGITCVVFPLFKKRYKAKVGHNLWEHEYDHVYMGIYNKMPLINTHEVSALRFVPHEDLAKEIAHHPVSFTSWFQLFFETVEDLYPVYLENLKEQ